MQYKHTIFIAIIALGAGFLIGHGTRADTSGSVLTNEGTHDSADVHASTFQQHTSRLVNIERSCQQQTAKLADVELTLAALETMLRATPRASDSTDHHVVAALPGETVMRQEINRLLREELRAVLAMGGQSEPQAQAEGAQAEDAKQTQENKEAFDTAYDIAEEALSTGQFSSENTRNFRHAMMSLTDKQQQELLEYLIPAINRGEIDPETSESLF